MGRVSLTEDYDDRSVIAKLNVMDRRVKENTTVVTAAEASAQASAAAAQETADRFAGSVGAVVQNANAQINASKAQVDQAKAEVDETVTTVAQAVQTANNASASAQQSANTVAGYDARLTAVEDADTHNVKLEGNQDITGIKTVPTEATGTSSKQIANSAKVGAELDNYAPMVRNTGNMKISGSKQFQATISRGAVAADMIANPETSVGATILSIVDKMNEETHNSLGSIIKVRNTNGENYLDIQSTSYGFIEDGVQKRINIFLRLLVSENSGNAQLILYRSKKNADGTGTQDLKSKVIATITASGVIS